MEPAKEPQYPALSDTEFLIADIQLRLEVLEKHIQFHAIQDADAKHDVDTLKESIKLIGASKASLMRIGKDLNKL